MANQVTKIYELKTLGYEGVFEQLKNIDATFKSIKSSKQLLNQTKFDTSDKAKVDDLNKSLTDEKIKTLELRLEKQRLANEVKSSQIAKQQEILTSKKAAEQFNIEAGSIKDLKNQALLLKTALEFGNSPTVNIGGTPIARAQAESQLRAINRQITQMTANMKGAQDFGTRLNNSLAAGFQSMKGQLSQIIFLYTGWFAAFREAASLIGENRKMSDSFADLQIRIRGTKEEVQTLFEQLKKIDTRTSLVGLIDIANVVSKKGVPREELAGLTKEFDKLNVVLGKEIGEPDTAVANIIKLITVFNDDKHVTAQRVQEIGTSLFKLTTTGVATGEFLTNFAERVGAVRGITGITLPNVFALGAALQQLGQRVELSSTSLIQLTTRIFADVPKYAAAAGKSVDDFRKTLQQNPFEALIQVAEGLKNLTPEDLGLKFEEIVQAFQEVGVTGVRIKAVLGDIATNADFVRQRMKDAAVSTADYGSQTAAADLKQHTFAATLDRITKAFETLGTNQAVQQVLAGVASVILLLVGNLGLIITVLATYAATWAIANSEMIAGKIAVLASNIAFTAQYAILTITQTATQAYAAALALFTGATTRATAATTLLGTSMKLLGIGAVITLIAVLAGAFTTLAAHVTDSVTKLKEHAKAQAIQQDITRAATEAINNQTASLNSWAAVVLSASASVDTKKHAMEELIKQYPKFNAALDESGINLSKFKQILQEVRGEIDLNARAMASSKLTEDRFKDVQTAVSLRQRVEIQSAQGGGEIKLEDLTEEEQKLFRALLPKAPRNSVDFSQLTGKVTGLLVNKKNIEQWKTLFKDTENQMLEVFDAYKTASIDLQNKVEAQNKENEDKLNATARKTLEDRIKAAQTTQVTGGELENLIKEINKQVPRYKEGDAKIKELITVRNEFQKRLDAFNLAKAHDKKFTGSRLSGEDKDELANIEAARRIELSITEQTFADLQLNHRATFEEEIKYAATIRDINTKYLDQKIKYLNDQKSLNAREKEELASFNKEKTDELLKYQTTVQTVLDKEFQLRARNLKATLTNQVNTIQTNVTDQTSDASLTETQRAQIKLDGDKQILSLQERFNGDMDALEKQFNQKTKENAEEGAKTRRDLIKDTIDIFNAQIRDAADAGDNDLNRLKTQAAIKTKDILESGKSSVQAAREIEKLNHDLAIQLLNSQIATQKIELELYQQGLSKKITSQKEYVEAVRKLAELESAYTAATVNKDLSQWEKFTKALKGFKDGLLEGTFQIKKYTDDAEGEAQKQKDAFTQAYNSIGQAIQEAEQGYFDRLNKTADKEHDLQTTRLNNEKQQVLARATSQAEKDSIEKQYAAKQAALDKKTSEEKKKIALKQIAIDFAIAIIKSIAQYGLPLALIPIAAETALYFVQRSNIQKQTFEHGGIAPTTTGGEIQGRSHSRGGVKFVHEAEDKELMIVSKKSAQSGVTYTVTGTTRQIASAINSAGGGNNFAPGGVIYKRYAEGGILGSSFPAPVYTPSIGGNNDFAAYHADIVHLADEQSKRIDRLEVILDTEKVTGAQRKRSNQNSIGVI